MEFFDSFVHKILEAAEEHAATNNNKFTSSQILKISRIMLSGHFKAGRYKVKKVSAWNLYQSAIKDNMPDTVRLPKMKPKERPQFTGDYAKAAAEGWQEHKEEYEEKARLLNEAGGKITEVPLPLLQKRGVRRLSDLVRLTATPTE